MATFRELYCDKPVFNVVLPGWVIGHIARNGQTGQSNCCSKHVYVCQPKPIIFASFTAIPWTVPGGAAHL
jgi:hypothetical protein